MKKIILLLASLMLLTFSISPVLSQDSQDMPKGQDWYTGDLYRMVPAAEHKKHFPNGHTHKDGDKNDRNCYFDKQHNSYFCQFDWEE